MSNSGGTLQWLAEGDLAWFILDAIDPMDMGEFYAVYRSGGWGAAAYDPAMMVGVLLYAYCQGIRSSRRIARALDGTKVAANASLAANRSCKALREEVLKMLDEAKKVDAEEDAMFGFGQRGDELPEELGRRAERLKRWGEAKAWLEREAQETASLAQQRLVQRQEEEAAAGKKKRGRKPKEVVPTPGEDAKANTTDPDSRTMKTRQGYVQGYNVQAIASQDQIMVAVGVTQEGNDVHATQSQCCRVWSAPWRRWASRSARGQPWPMRATGVRLTS